MRVPKLTSLERGLLIYLIVLTLLLALAWIVNAWVTASPVRPIGIGFVPFSSLWL
jgi:hypothetical protein